MKTEVWKDIEGYAGLYQVSTFGRVKALPREQWNGPHIVNLLETLAEEFDAQFVMIQNLPDFQTGTIVPIKSRKTR